MRISVPTPRSCLTLCAVLALAAGTKSARAETGDIVYPADANVIDVVRDRGWDNTGKTDLTQQFNELYAGMGRQLQVVYFPKGTYLVSGMVRGKHDQSRSDKSHSHGPWLVGESRTETVIRLKDGTWPEDTLDSADIPKRLDERAVLHTGDCTNTTFNQHIRNLTVNIGRNNAGAIGIVYITSNSGQLADVDIVSEDGKGSIGLSLSGEENGPGGIRDMRIQGFKRGIFNAAPYHMALSNIVIENATEWGLVNRGIIAIENIRVAMAGGAQAIWNSSKARLLVVNGEFTGTAPGVAAIKSEGEIFARNLKATGYARVLASSGGKNAPPAPEGATLTEFASGKPAGVFFDTGRSLNLPIKQPPYPAWEKDMGKWSNPLDYKTDKNSWDDALTAALAAPGKTHMVLPYGAKTSVAGPIRIGGDYSRITGTMTQFDSKPFTENSALVIEDGSAPVVMLQGLIGAPTIIVRTGRTVILDSARTGRGQKVIAEGTGDLFINDFGGILLVRNPKQRVWIRHYNHEAKDLALTVESGQVWILGWKSENLGQKMVCKQGGVVEILGFDSYEVGRDQAGTTPAFEVIDGQFSVASVYQAGKASYKHIVNETRNGVLRSFTTGDSPDGKNCILYTGYDPAQAVKTPR